MAALTSMPCKAGSQLPSFKANWQLIKSNCKLYTLMKRGRTSADLIDVLAKENTRELVPEEKRENILLEVKLQMTRSVGRSAKIS